MILTNKTLQKIMEDPEIKKTVNEKATFVDRQILGLPLVPITPLDEEKNIQSLDAEDSNEDSDSYYSVDDESYEEVMEEIQANSPGKKAVRDQDLIDARKRLKKNKKEKVTLVK